MQFDNRGSKVMDASSEKKIIAALAKHVFLVPAGNVVRSTGMGQSSLTNHQVGGLGYRCTHTACQCQGSLAPRHSCPAEIAPR